MPSVHRKKTVERKNKPSEIVANCAQAYPGSMDDLKRVGSIYGKMKTHFQRKGKRVVAGKVEELGKIYMNLVKKLEDLEKNHKEDMEVKPEEFMEFLREMDRDAENGVAEEPDLDQTVDRPCLCGPESNKGCGVCLEEKTVDQDANCNLEARPCWEPQSPSNN